MAETKFTPGPWHIAGKGTIRRGKDEWIGNVHWRNREPNAHLIAAAPDLYAEGERTASIMETVAEALPDGESKTILLSAAHTQRAALAKARGA